MSTEILDILRAYSVVIKDLKVEEIYYLPDALKETLKHLEFRVAEIKTTFADEITQELEELSRAMFRHPANAKQAPPKTPEELFERLFGE